MENGNGEIKRGLFSKSSGGLDFQRLLEQMIPTAILGGIVIYANTLVTQSKLDANAAKQESDRARIERKVEDTASQVNAQNGELIRLTAKVVAYLEQQTTLNAAMDQRVLYLERNSKR